MEEAIRGEHQREAAGQVSIANVVTSLRLCAELDWQKYVEAVSVVERVLQRDPAGVYARQDFLTRDRYRQAVEELSAPDAEAQVRVALRVVESARLVAEREGAAATGAHVGHHLIGRGRRGLETDVAFRPGLVKGLRRAVFANATLAYLGAIALASGALLLAGTAYVHDRGGSLALAAVAAVLLLLPVSELATGLVQRLVARFAPPRRLPRLDLSEAVPDDARTLVVVPTLLTSVEAAQHLVEHLEILALGNLDPRIHFAILGDFTDATTPDTPADAAILAVARDGVTALNARLSDGRGDRFFLFHRAREWNPREGAWMGWERKRGKLEELNRLLRGATDTSFDVQVGELSVLPSVRYCITLDTDTRLPRDVAKKLIGIIAHPLNRPRFDAASGRVVEGYGILQPRVSVTTTSAAGSRFARLFAGHTGVDPYTTAVSDTYQDLFGEGTFTGKGLYDVDAFKAALDGRVPDNALLSHDLFEGLHARTRWSPTSSWSTTTRPACWPTRGAPTGGPAATGKSCCGCSPSCRRGRGWRATGCRSSRGGRFSTTCAAASWPPPPSRCSSARGRSFPAARRCGRWPSSRPSRSPSCPSPWACCPARRPGSRGARSCGRSSTTSRRRWPASGCSSPSSPRRPTT